MKASGIVALTLLGLAVAAPHKNLQRAKRDLVWVTETAEVVETVVQTTTLWVDAAPTEAAHAHSPTPEPATTEVKTTPAYTPTPEATSAVEATTEKTSTSTPAYTPTPEATSAVEATTEKTSTSTPAPTSTETPSSTSTPAYTPPAPTTTETPSSTYTPAPATTETPSSTYTPPAPTTEAPSSTYVAPTPEATSSAKTDSAVVAAESAGGEIFNPSRITYYSPSVGLGSCGVQYSDDSNVVALAAGNMNSGLCNKKLTIEVNGQQFGAFIGDTCPGCPSDGSLDITPTLFTKMMGSTDAGVITNAKWWWD